MYNETLMKYLNIFQVRKEKDIPIYNPFHENLVIDGFKIMPNES